ncbi:hypothetical protein LO80_02935 [Candidatus Francisella endociliophora]|uniref:Lipoprotein n=1 Tax=Candidatus Francisella endociliophora TaxID=653937 RepID=A0A097EN90_9GAMM|nr:hypothetical protein [Francisella sp. FSC1006]AIT09032.1 hypothetical protein LO80_02935 [Francisella sp. FSC1006]
MYKQIIAIIFAFLVLGGCMSITKNPKVSKKDIPVEKTQVNQVLPPKYLSIDGFKDCLNTQTKGSASFYCMPNNKPAQCSDKAWEELSKLEGSEKIPNCESK